MSTRITQKWREAEEASNRITRIINTRDCAEECEPEYWEERLEIVKDGLEKMSADELGALNSLLFCFDGRVKSEIRHEYVQRRNSIHNE
jgi:hypothetical protein